jgi:hypothetical protein
MRPRADPRSGDGPEPGMASAAPWPGCSPPRSTRSAGAPRSAMRRRADPHGAQASIPPRRQGLTEASWRHPGFRLEASAKSTTTRPRGTTSHRAAAEREAQEDIQVRPAIGRYATACPRVGRPARFLATRCTTPLAPLPYACSNFSMDVRRPWWWSYPTECGHGHVWAPGRILVSWMPCLCDRARKERPRGSGHRMIECRTPGCDWVVYEPPHDPASARLLLLR